MKPAGRVNDRARNPRDAHGRPCCYHDVIGPAVQGSSNVRINGRQALRVTDPGVHSSCCDSNTWVAEEGSSTVRINGLRAHRRGDTTRHCGGPGELVEGSPDVRIGD